MVFHCHVHATDPIPASAASMAEAPQTDGVQAGQVAPGRLAENLHADDRSLSLGPNRQFKRSPRRTIRTTRPRASDGRVAPAP